MLIASTVADHNSFEIVRIQLFGLLFRLMNESLCANGNEVRNVGSPAVKRFVGCPVVEGTRWTSILEMGDRSSEFCPEFFGEAGPSEDGSNSFANRPVCPFRHPVLLRCVWCCFLVMNAEFLA